MHDVLTKHGLTQHFWIEREDGRAIRCEWDTLQAVKAEVLGSDVQAIEVYPADTDLVNDVNRRHFWVMPEGVVPKKMLGTSRWD